jgi:DNA-binding IclR family transcriptional regulator
VRRDYNYVAIRGALTDEWQHTNEIAAKIGWPAGAVRRYLNVCVHNGWANRSRDGAGLWWRRASPSPGAP